MKDELEDLVEAMAALDNTVPDGTFERFSRRVAARLEEGMERTDSSVHDRSPAGDEPAIVGPLPAREENSGLHEIRELATTAKRRLSAQRSSPQLETADDLLTTSGQFKTVVLPDPGRRSGPLPVAGTTATAPAPATSSSGGRGVMWAALGAAGLAAAAAIALFVIRPSTGDSSRADEGVVARNEAVPARKQPESVPAAQPAAPSPGPASGAAASGEPALAASAELEAAAPAEPAEPAAVGGAVPAEEKSRAADDRPRRERAADSLPAALTEKAKEARETRETRKGKAKPKAGSMDELLSSVTGGVEESRPAPSEPSKPAKVEKSGLDRDDVSRAMGAIGDRARACHGEEGAVGSVNIRFTVDPSGKVSRAAATGKFAGTATGRCVAAAVKSASFPRWDGGPMSFTYPFLLSQ